MEMSFLRPTSPLTFEPLSPSPSEILLRDSEEDDDIDQRASKRRRIEKLGQQYLRGQPLLISTASLKGPLNASWVNPWKKAGLWDSVPDATKVTRERRAREDWQKQEVRREAQKIHGKVEIFPTSIYSARKAVRDRQAGESLGISHERGPRLVQPPNPFPEDIVDLLEAKAKRRANRNLQREQRRQRATELRKDGLGRDSDHAVDLETDEGKVQAEVGTSSSINEVRSQAVVNDRPICAQVQDRADTPTPPPQLPRTPPYQKPITPQTRSLIQPQHSVAKPDNRIGERRASTEGPSGFTPINKPPKAIPAASPTRNVTETAGSPASLRFSTDHDAQDIPIAIVDEITLAEAEADVLEGFKRAKALAREAASEAIQPLRRNSVIDYAERCVMDLNAGSLASERSSSNATLHTSTPRELEEVKSPPVTSSARRLLVAVEIPRQRGPTTSSPTESFGSFRELPPSTNLPAFEYRRAAAARRNPLKASNANSKVIATDESRRKPRLMKFASSPHSESSASPRPKSLSKAQGQPGDENSGLRGSDTAAVDDARWDLVDRYTNKIITKETFDDQNGSQQPVGKQIRDIFRQSASSFHREQCNADQDTRASRSALHRLNDLLNESNDDKNDRSPLPVAGLPESTGDHNPFPEAKEPGDEAIDQYLSTQAAIAQAQRSFQADISSPTKQPSPPPQLNAKAPTTSITTISKRDPPPLGFVTPFRNFHTPPPAGPTLPKLVDEEEPLSTQELLNGISPFTFSTIKKPPTVKTRASFAPSPLDIPIMSGDFNGDDTTIFGKLGLDMDTSPEEAPPSQKPETSKPLRKSALKKPKTPQQSSSHGTSFSITPDGVLKEVYNHDGQGGRVSDAELNAMIDDVGSFLETWDVETEMKKCASNTVQTPVVGSGKEGKFGKRVLLSGQKGK